MFMSPVLEILQAADTSTTGMKLKYVVPTGIHAEVRGFGAVENAAGATVTFDLIPKSGTEITILTTSASDTMPMAGERIALRPGDAVQWNCKSAAALSNWDLWISIMVYSS